MGSANPDITIRLGVVGDKEVDAALKTFVGTGDEIGEHLAAGFAKGAAAAESAAARTERARATIAAAAETSGATLTDKQTATLTRAYTDQMAQQERQAEALRNALDPLRVAQAAYDKELATYAALLKSGNITEAEHTAAVASSSRALNTAKRNLEEHSGALGLNRGQFITAQSAVLRFTDSILAGQNPIRAFALEAHKGAEVLAQDDGGMAGGLAKASAFVNPLTIGIAALSVAVVAGVTAWTSYADAIAKANALALGAGAVIGVTGQDMEDYAHQAASSGELTVGAARDIEEGYVRLGGIGKANLAPLIGLTKDFAAATGVDAKQATQDLGKAFADPVHGAEELTSKYGFLTQAQIEQIRQLADQNDLYGAQRQLLDDVAGKLGGAADQAEGLARAWTHIKSNASQAFDAVGKFLNQHGAEILTGATGGLLAPFEYMTGGGQGPLKADPAAAGKRLAEQALEASEAYTGRKTREDLEAKANELKRALANPDAVRSLSQQADGISGARAQLEAYTHAIDTYLPPAQKKLELDEATARIAEARTVAGKRTAGADRARIEQAGVVETDAQAQAAIDAGADRTGARMANRDANKAAEDAKRQMKEFLDNVQKTWGEIDKANAAFLKSFGEQFPAEYKKTQAELAEPGKQHLAQSDATLATLVAQQDQKTLSEAELATITMSADQRQRALEIVRATIAYQDQGVHDDNEGLEAIIAGIKAQDQLNQAIERQSAAMQEVNDFATRFVDDLTAGKNVVSDIKEELLKLAVENPLKNLLGGTHQTDLSDVGGIFGKLFGGGGGTAGMTWTDAMAPSVPGNAVGTDYWRGGPTWIAENGPEIVNLPRGASVTPMSQARAPMSSGAVGGRGDTHVHVYAEDAVLADTVSGWVRDGMNAAGQAGAIGGATMAGTTYAKRRRRRLR